LRPLSLIALLLGVKHPSAPEDIVQSDQTARGQESHRLLVVGGVVFLVGVDIHKVEARFQPAQGVEGGLLADLNLVSVRASAKKLLAVRMASGSMSQVTRRPSSGRAAAIISALKPVNIPISSTRLACWAATNI